MNPGYLHSVPASRTTGLEDAEFAPVISPFEVCNLITAIWPPENIFEVKKTKITNPNYDHIQLFIKPFEYMNT